MLLGLGRSTRVARLFQGIPGVAMGTLPEPFWADATTFGTRKDRFNFGHEKP
jgi:hypothetical protein